jgi:predicted NAD/FAD-binding protein
VTRAAVGVKRLEPRPEPGEGCAGIIEVGGDLVQAPVDLGVGLRQETPAVGRQLDPDPAAIGRVVVAASETSGDEPVDHTRHAGAADGQLLGQHRRRLRAAAEDAEDPVLGQREIHRGKSELDLPGEPRHHPTWSRGCFVSHTIRVSNHRGSDVTLRGATKGSRACGAAPRELVTVRTGSGFVVHTVPGMSERSRFPSPMTRRDVVRRAIGLATFGAGSVLTGRDVAAAAARRPGSGRTRSDRHRVAIIGAGAGGVAAAYFLAGTHDVELFEARSRIGGHCDSRVIDYRGRRIIVDLGAQFFHPDTHPIYVTLLEQLGLYDPARPNADDTLEAPGSLCIFTTAGGPPVFSSSHPFSTPLRSIDFANYTQLARNAVLSNLSWETTVDAWIRSLSVSQSFKNEVVYPWITALIGSRRADALRASARSILQTFALAFPADIVEGATTYNSTIGLQGNLQRMLDRSPAVRVHLSTGTHAVTHTRPGWLLHTAAGQQGPYRSVVVNAPPLAGRRLLPRGAAFAHLTEVLSAYEYFDSRLLIHTDPAYVARDRTDWAAYNAEVNGRECEGSVWVGALHKKLPSGATIDVFKSWAERRRTDPTQIRLRRRFTHPLISRPAIQAARALRPLQGRDGLYFSGQYTTGFDSQESAVYSAMKVAASLAPGSRTLASLETLLATRGRAGISYDL